MNVIKRYEWRIKAVDKNPRLIFHNCAVNDEKYKGKRTCKFNPNHYLEICMECTSPIIPGKPPKKLTEQQIEDQSYFDFTNGLFTKIVEVDDEDEKPIPEDIQEERDNIDLYEEPEKTRDLYYLLNHYER